MMLLTLLVRGSFNYFFGVKNFAATYIRLHRLADISQQNTTIASAITFLNLVFHLQCKQVALVPLGVVACQLSGDLHN
jgi:hypothetical protein